MKIRLILLLCLLSSFCCNNAYASKRILVVLGSNGQVYRSAYEGLVKNLDRSLVKISKTVVATKNTKRVISRYQPDLIIAIGNNALFRLQNVADLPVGYVLCTNIMTVANKKNFFGISSDIDHCTVINQVQKILPNTKNLALLYNPEKTTIPLVEVKDCIPEISLVAVPVTSSLGFATAVRQNVKGVDGVVIFPDANLLLTKQTMEYLFQFTIETQIPVISFNKEPVFKNSAIMFDVDTYECGKNIATMANDLIFKNSSDLRKVDNSFIKANVNRRSVKMLKLDVGQEFKKR